MTRVKKIACISMAFPVASETFHSKNVKALAETGLDIRVFSLLPKRRNHEKMIEERGLKSIPIATCNTANYLFGFLIALSHPKLLWDVLAFITKNVKGSQLVKSLVLTPRVFSIWSKIRRERPDVVNLLWGHYPALVGYVIKKTNPDMLLSMRLAAYDLEMEYGCSKALAPLVDVIHTQASVNVPKIEKLGFPRKKIKIIYNGLDLGENIAQGPKTPGRIITIGRLIKPKGIDRCLETFSLILKKWPESKLIILGEGPDRKNLENLAKQLGIFERTHFKGHVDMTQVAAELSASDVFLFMSYKPGERLPNVIKEAMANGAICVVSRTPGIEELVTNGESGFVLEDNTPEEAAEIIDTIFNNPKDFDGMRKKAFENVTRKFDCRREMAKLLAEWETTLEAMTGANHFEEVRL